MNRCLTMLALCALSIGSLFGGSRSARAAGRPETTFEKNVRLGYAKANPFDSGRLSGGAEGEAANLGYDHGWQAATLQNAPLILAAHPMARMVLQHLVASITPRNAARIAAAIPVGLVQAGQQAVRDSAVAAKAPVNYWLGVREGYNAVMFGGRR